MPGTRTIAEIAALTGGQVEEGAADIIISGVADLKTAQKKDISFLGNPKYTKTALESNAGAIFVPQNITGTFNAALIRVENPSQAFAQIADLFTPAPIEWPKSIHPSAVIALDVVLGTDIHIGPHVVIESGASIGNGTHIGAGCYIGHHVTISEKTFLHPRVTVREDCKIGQRVIIHSGAIIGSDGFGYEFCQGKHVKIPQTGYVQIDDDVEIGANTTIDRGRFSRTWIQEGCKIDNLVMIAHNVVVGKHSILVAQAGIAGSTQCGQYVTIAGQAGISGHLTVGDHVTITAQSGVSKDCEPNQVYSGYHARPIKESLKLEAYIKRLPELFKKIK